MRTVQATRLALAVAAALLVPLPASAIHPVCGYPPSGTCYRYRCDGAEWVPYATLPNGTSCRNPSPDPYHPSTGACRSGACVVPRCYPEYPKVFEPFPVVESILYSPLGDQSYVTYEEGQVAGHRWQASVAGQTGSTMELSLGRTTIRGEYTLGSVTGRSLSLGWVTATGPSLASVADLPTYLDDHFYLWVNPTVTFDRKCDGTRVATWSFLDNKFPTCPPEAGGGPRVVDLSIGQILGSPGHRPGEPRGVPSTDTCKAEVLNRLQGLSSTDRASFLDLDPFYYFGSRAQALPSFNTIDVAKDDADREIPGHGRFRYLGRFPLPNYPSGEVKHPLGYTCAENQGGPVGNISFERFKRRTLVSTGDSFDLEFLFMSETSTCTWTKWYVFLGASASCTLQTDAWLDRMYGTIAMLPVVSDTSGCSR